MEENGEARASSTSSANEEEKSPSLTSSEEAAQNSILVTTLPIQNRAILSEDIRVPDVLVGLVIGKGGAHINKLQNTTGCRIQFDHSMVGFPERLCTLTGTRDAIDRARIIFQKIVRNTKVPDSMISETGLIGQHNFWKGTNSTQIVYSNNMHQNTEDQMACHMTHGATGDYTDPPFPVFGKEFNISPNKNQTANGPQRNSTQFSVTWTPSSNKPVPPFLPDPASDIHPMHFGHPPPPPPFPRARQHQSVSVSPPPFSMQSMAESSSHFNGVPQQIPKPSPPFMNMPEPTAQSSSLFPPEHQSITEPSLPFLNGPKTIQRSSQFFYPSSFPTNASSAFSSAAQPVAAEQYSGGYSRVQRTNPSFPQNHDKGMSPLIIQTMYGLPPSMCSFRNGRLQDGPLSKLHTSFKNCFQQFLELKRNREHMELQLSSISSDISVDINVAPPTMLPNESLLDRLIRNLFYEHGRVSYLIMRIEQVTDFDAYPPIHLALQNLEDSLKQVQARKDEINSTNHCQHGLATGIQRSQIQNDLDIQALVSSIEELCDMANRARITLVYAITLTAQHQDRLRYGDSEAEPADAYLMSSLSLD